MVEFTIMLAVKKNVNFKNRKFIKLAKIAKPF